MIKVCELIYETTNVLNKIYDKYLSPTCFGTRMPSSGILADPLTWKIPWGWHPGAETCRGFVINCTLLSAPVGWCINYYNMHCMSNIQKNKICPASLRETCQWLKFPLNGLRAQSRVSPVVGLLPSASGPACLGVAFSALLMKQLYRCDSVVISSFVRTGYTMRKWGWLLGKMGYSITHHCPLYK